MLISKESLAERLGPAESSAVRKERARTEAMRGTLRDGGVNPDLIDAAVAASRFVVEEVAESADGIKRAVASTAEQATISFRQVYKDTFTGLDAKKVAKGTVLVAAVYIAQKVCEQVILAALRRAGLGALAPKMAFVLMAVAVAPVIEEYARRLSRRMGADNGFTASIATVEFVLGTSTMMSRGASFLAAATARIVTTLALHHVAETIQQYFTKKAELAGQPANSKAGLLVAIGFHSAWNMMATLVADLDAFVETTELSEELADLSLI